jgi:hypothetical protein
MTVPASSDGEPAQLTRMLNHLHKRFQEPTSIPGLCKIRQNQRIRAVTRASVGAPPNGRPLRQGEGLYVCQATVVIISLGSAIYPPQLTCRLAFSAFSQKE